MDRDPASPTYGKPKTYGFASVGDLVDFHPSRLVLQYGADQADPWTATGPNYGWGDSVVTAIWEAMRQGDSVMHNVASLVFEANVDVLKVAGLSELVSQPKYEERFLKRTALAQTGNTHTASAPGEAPAVDTGRLRQSALTHPIRHDGHNVVGSVGVATDYALALELGTEKMEPRPHVSRLSEKPRAEKIGFIASQGLKS